MSASLQRANLLYQQNRCREALDEVQNHFREEPEDARGFALQGLCLSRLGKNREAVEAAQLAVQHEPDEPSSYYVLAVVLHTDKKEFKAEEAIKEAIRLDPYDADFHGLLAAFHLHKDRWRDALESAETALQCDPEHIQAANVRSTALVQLGRREEAGASLEASLHKDPDNSHTHANKGWACLHEGQHKKALEHFREALRLEPNNEWARQGIVQAMQAHYVIYRPILKYFLWMSRFTAKQRWGIIIGLYIVYRVILKAITDVPASRPVTIPIGIAYLLFVYSSWTGNVMFNLVLRLNPFGRLVLSDTERAASTCVGFCLLAALVSAGYAVAIAHYAWLWVTLGFMLFVLPLARSFHQEPGGKRKFFVGYAAVLALLGLAGIFGLILQHSGLGQLGLLYFIGIAIFTWIGNL